MIFIKNILILTFVITFTFGYRVHIEDNNNNNGGLFDEFFRTIRSIIEEEPPINEKLNNTTPEKVVTKFPKEFPNKTNDFIREERELHASSDTSSDIACTMKSDCNETTYCDKLSYTCLPCSSDNEHCSHDQECCSGHFCNVEKKTCQKKKGQNGDKCESADDCLRDHCCTLSDNGDGICRAYLKEGEDCSADNLSPFFFYPSASFDETMSGLPSKCPCQPSLHCKRRESFFFFESEKCVKAIPSSKQRHSIQLKFKKPLFHFHKETDIPLDLPEEEKISDNGITKTITQTQTSGPITIHRVYKIFRFPMTEKKNRLTYHKKRNHFFLSDLLKHTLPYDNRQESKWHQSFSPKSSVKINIKSSNRTDNRRIFDTSILDKVHPSNASGNVKTETDSNNSFSRYTFNPFEDIFKSIMQGVVKSFNYSL